MFPMIGNGFGPGGRRPFALRLELRNKNHRITHVPGAIRYEEYAASGNIVKGVIDEVLVVDLAHLRIYIQQNTYPTFQR